MVSTDSEIVFASTFVSLLWLGNWCHGGSLVICFSFSTFKKAKIKMNSCYVTLLNSHGGAYIIPSPAFSAREAVKAVEKEKYKFASITFHKLF
jgi:hypothetical protein